MYCGPMSCTVDQHHVFDDPRHVFFPKHGREGCLTVSHVLSVQVLENELTLYFV